MTPEKLLTQGFSRDFVAEARAERQRRIEECVTSAARYGDSGIAAAALELLVELWRGRLEFKPWAVFAATSPERTGRTTRALLRALAEAAVRELPLSITCGRSDSHGERYCLRLARDMASTLGLEHNGRGLVIEPERVARVAGRARIRYVDHYDEFRPSE